jgi:hypothetical protein
VWGKNNSLQLNFFSHHNSNEAEQTLSVQCPSLGFEPSFTFLHSREFHGIYCDSFRATLSAGLLGHKNDLETVAYPEMIYRGALTNILYIYIYMKRRSPVAEGGDGFKP